MNSPKQDVKEKSLIIPGPAGDLEISWHAGSNEGQLARLMGLAVICHPHPQQGGTMDNKVVTTLMRAYRDVGISVIRFNFRGVGKSAGTFAQAIGELDDLRAVVSWAQAGLSPQRIILAGFSFGSSIAAQVSYEVANLAQLTLVAPPIERYAYDRGGMFNAPVCVIQGDHDERVSAGGVYRWAGQLQGKVRLLRYPEAGHFFHGFLSPLKNDLTQCLVSQLG